MQGLLQIGTAQLLLHETDLRAFGHGDLARIRGDIPGHDLQERGLAAPVGAHQGQPRAGMDLHGQALEEVHPGIGFGYGLNGDL